jgi:hypothetical protein
MFLILFDSIFDILQEIDLGQIIAMLALELIFEMFQISKSGFHFSDFIFGFSQFISDAIIFLETMRTIDGGKQFVGFVGFDTFLFVVRAERLIV